MAIVAETYEQFRKRLVGRLCGFVALEEVTAENGVATFMADGIEYQRDDIYMVFRGRREEARDQLIAFLWSNVCPTNGLACTVCGRTFIPRNVTARICSDRCRAKKYRSWDAGA